MYGLFIYMLIKMLQKCEPLVDLIRLSKGADTVCVVIASKGYNEFVPEYANTMVSDLSKGYSITAHTAIIVPPTSQSQSKKTKLSMICGVSVIQVVLGISKNADGVHDEEELEDGEIDGEGGNSLLVIDDNDDAGGDTTHGGSAQDESDSAHVKKRGGRPHGSHLNPVLGVFEDVPPTDELTMKAAVRFFLC